MTDTDHQSAFIRPIASPGLTWRWAIIVALAFGAFAAPHIQDRYEPNTWLERDGSFYFTTLLAMTEHGSIEQRAEQPESWYAQRLAWNDQLPEDWSNVAKGRGDGWYPKHSILLPILSVPFYILMGTIGTLVVNVGMNLLFVLLIFLVARRAARVEIAALLAIIVSALPFVQLQTYGFSNDLLGADLALGAVELAMAGWFGVAGTLAGFAIWSRLTNAAVVPGLLLIGWDAGGRRGVTRAVLMSLIPLGLLGAFDTWAFGAPWTTSYQNVLVREHGQMQIASHVKAFNVPWNRGIRRVTIEPEGVLGKFPLLIPGLLGFMLVAWRRTLLAAGFVLFMVLPLLAVTTYDWYRPHFLLAQFGASVFGLAAGLNAILPTAKPEAPRAPWIAVRSVGGFIAVIASVAANAHDWFKQHVALTVGVALLFGLAAGVGTIISVDPAPLSRPVRRVLAGGLVVALLGILAVRISTRADPSLLSSHIHEGRNFLDDIPCDYWNPQRERWECSHYDPEMWAMTGAILNAPEKVNGQPRRGIWMHPSPTRKWRRMVFQKLDATGVDLDFAMADEGRFGPVQIEVLPRGGEKLALTVERPGDDHRITAKIAPGEGPALEIRVRANDPQWKPLLVEGVMTR